MTAELWPFQAEDVNLMADKPYFLNGNAVGMGKTVEHIREVANWFDNHFDASRATEPLEYLVSPEHFSVLILTLKAAIPQWELWIERVCPELRGFFTITNHEQLRTKNAEPWFKTKWTFVIVDEAHRFKNRKALQTRALKKLKAQHRREATGSKLPPEELWSLLNFLDPKRWSSYWRFFEEYVDYYTEFRTVGGKVQGFKVIVGAKNENKLRKELEGISIFRKKKDCYCAYSRDVTFTSAAQRAGPVVFKAKVMPHDHLADLPDMPEPVYRYVDLEGKQARAYRDMKEEALAWVGENEDQPLPAPVVIAQLRRLQMIADAHLEEYIPKSRYGEPVYTEYKMTLPSAKLGALWDIIEGTDEPIVVFSQFRQMILLAANYLAERNVDYIMMHGQSDDKWKRESWQQFQAGQSQAFLTTIGAGGTGIDLYRASVCVFLDRTYSPTQNEQAEGRLHRAGQKNPVQRFYITARDTVDQHVEEKLTFKADIIRRIFGG